MTESRLKHRPEKTATPIVRRWPSSPSGRLGPPGETEVLTPPGGSLLVGYAGGSGRPNNLHVPVERDPTDNAQVTLDRLPRWKRHSTRNNTFTGGVVRVGHPLLLKALSQWLEHRSMIPEQCPLCCGPVYHDGRVSILDRGNVGGKHELLKGRCGKCGAVLGSHASIAKGLPDEVFWYLMDDLT